MKKAFVTLILLLVVDLSLCAQSEVTFLKAYKILVQLSNKSEPIISNTNTDIVINFSTKRCVVYSPETQIIDFKEERRFTDEIGYAVRQWTATDSDYRKITFRVMTHPIHNTTFVGVGYKNLVYLYFCLPTEPFEI